MFEKSRKECGSVTIEATISLSAFMFAIVTILTLVNICFVQAKVSMAINSTAKELSHYSYLYSLTGIGESRNKLEAAADEAKKSSDEVIGDVNTIFTEIQNLGKSEHESAEDISGLLSNLDSSYKNISEAGGSLKDSLEKLAEDPKKVAFGIFKIAATDGLNLVESRLIAAPLSKTLCKKNFVFGRGGDVESYLRFLGVKPDAKGSYLGGMDFSKSTLFPDSSNEIKVTVSYDVKVIALLPIDFSFHFCQTAVTQGWLAGHESYRTTSEQLVSSENDTIWTKGTLSERVELIRHQGIMDFISRGYDQVCDKSYSDVHVYSSTENEFVAIHSLNPLYSDPGSDALTLDDINDTVIREQIEHLCAGIYDTSNAHSTVTVKTKKAGGSTDKPEYTVENPKAKIVLVIPEDEGLKARIEEIVKSAKTRGVTVEVLAQYGNGARTTTVSPKTEVEK